MTWIVADVTTWEPGGTYDVWHDRAAFHFLTRPEDRAAYAQRVLQVRSRVAADLGKLREDVRRDPFRIWSDRTLSDHLEDFRRLSMEVRTFPMMMTLLMLMVMVPGVAFSIEPGIYIPGKIGMRTEVNVYMVPGEAVVTPSEYQRDLLVV